MQHLLSRCDAGDWERERIRGRNETKFAGETRSSSDRDTHVRVWSGHEIDGHGPVERM